jgi:2-keto-4-pentenoate hydratase
MSGIEPRLASALAVQLETWRAALAAGADRVGWKLGVGDRERIGAGPVIGHLTSSTQLAPGSSFRPDNLTALHVDAEVALAMASDVAPDATLADVEAAIAGYGAAIELVDLGPVAGGPEAIVATNVFHRAFALGPLTHPRPAAGTHGTLLVNGELRATAPAAADYLELTRCVAVILGAMGERLRAGDQLITGSVVQVPVRRGDEIVVDLGALGRVGLSLAR